MNSNFIPIQEYLTNIIIEITDIEENAINNFHTTESERKIIRDSVWRIRENCEDIEKYLENLSEDE